MSRYLAIRGSAPGPLFICANGTPLSPSIVNAWLPSILKAAGIPGIIPATAFGLVQLRLPPCQVSRTVLSRFWVSGPVTVTRGIFELLPT